MNPAQTRTLRQLLLGRRVASLGTLHDGEPHVSMVPFARLPGGEFVIHVSHLSSHTKDMLENPRVSLMVAAPDDPATPEQALPRVTIQGRAEQVAASAPGFFAARDAYLERFPQAADMLEIPGFSFVAIRPSSARFIAGFAQATTLTPDALARAILAADT